MYRRAVVLTLLLVVTFTASAPLRAQDAATGQFWVRAFEDRDGNGTRDPGEPLITGGLGVSLLTGNGIVIATGLLDESPYAAQGQIGFQFLTPGEYTLVIAAPEFRATTESSFTRTIAAGTIPMLVEFGAQRIPLDAAPEGAADSAVATRSLLGLPVALTEEQRFEIGRIALAALGAVIVAGVMFFGGMIIYAGLLRRKYRREMAALRARYTTGSLPAVQLSTGESERYTPPV
jgi:hypothetical protein